MILRILKHGNPKYDGYQRGSASMVYNLFDKKTGPRASVNEELSQYLHMLGLNIIFGLQN